MTAPEPAARWLSLARVLTPDLATLALAAPDFLAVTVLVGLVFLVLFALAVLVFLAEAFFEAVFLEGLALAVLFLAPPAAAVFPLPLFWVLATAFASVFLALVDFALLALAEPEALALSEDCEAATADWAPVRQNSASSMASSNGLMAGNAGRNMDMVRPGRMGLSGSDR
ncbi:hypothetical protein [Paracandidimonas soli]|uniref:hypothetical protein n=1 Tax=Paracandidimonas soli TaxID=1917182 RepID=UPI00334027A8